MDREALERDFSSQRRIFLRPLFKYTAVDGLSTKDPNNFPNAPGVVTLIRNTGENLKVWDHLTGAKDVYSKLQLAQIESPELKKLAQFYSGRVPVLLHPYLYRTLKLTFPKDVSVIVTKG